MIRVVRHWYKLPREMVDISSLETFKIGLDGALSNVIWHYVPLFVAKKLDQVTIKGLFKLKRFYDLKILSILVGVLSHLNSQNYLHVWMHLFCQAVERRMLNAWKMTLWDSAGSSDYTPHDSTCQCRIAPWVWSASWGHSSHDRHFFPPDIENNPLLSLRGATYPSVSNRRELCTHLTLTK